MIADALHVGFTVRDLDASIDWYTRVLGLELVHRQRSDNAYIRQLVGVDDAVLEVAQFAIPGHPPRVSSHLLELIQYVEGAAAPSAMPATNALATGHLALIVTDIHTRWAALIAAGATAVNEPVLITAGANAGGYACYLRDPDGILLELMQFSPERAARLGIEQSDSDEGNTA